MAERERNDDAIEAGRGGRQAKRASLVASANAAAARGRGAAGAAPAQPSGSTRRAGASSQAGRARHARRADAEGQGAAPPHARRAEGQGAAPPRAGSRRASSPAAGQRETLFQFARRNRRYILSVVATIALFTVALMSLHAATAQLARQDAGPGEDAYTSSYDWSCLDWAGDRCSYVAGGQVKSRLGIDVSEHQGEIDWEAVAGDGIDFAIIRLGYRGVTEGELYLDEFFEANFAGARAAGLDCGVYFFSQAQNAEEAREEAEFALSHIGGADLAYPIVFDSEEAVMGLEDTRTSGLDDETMTAIAEAFCARVEEAGYRSLLYGNAADIARLCHGSPPGRGVWWAEYGTGAPSASLDIEMWQYTNAGSVAGIGTNVDMDIDLSGALG